MAEVNAVVLTSLILKSTHSVCEVRLTAGRWIFPLHQLRTREDSKPAWPAPTGATFAF